MKKCRYCKTEIDSKAKICPQCHKKQSNPLVRYLGLAIIIVGIIAIFSSVGGSSDEDGSKCYITLEEFNRIENGMTYEEVKEIVGCDGTVNSDTEVMGTKMTIYSWYGKDGISNANVNIQNNKLINKTQIGLD